MDSSPPGTIDVQLTMNGERVTQVSGNPGGQLDVVVDLKPVSLGCLHRDSLVSAGANGFGQHGGVEGYLASAASGGKSLVGRRVISRRARALARDQESDSACESEKRPSRSDFPSMTPPAPAAATKRMSSRLLMPPE